MSKLQKFTSAKIQEHTVFNYLPITQKYLLTNLESQQFMQKVNILASVQLNPPWPNPNIPKYIKQIPAMHINTHQNNSIRYVLYVSIQTTFKFTFYISHLSGVHRDIRFGPTVCTLIFHHSMCSSPEVQCCDCLLNDDKE